MLTSSDDETDFRRYVSASNSASSSTGIMTTVSTRTPNLRHSSKQRGGRTASRSGAGNFGLIFMFLVCGVGFCLLDALYIIKYIMDDRHTGGSSSSTSTTASSTSTVFVLAPNGTLQEYHTTDILKIKQKLIAEMKTEKSNKQETSGSGSRNSNDDNDDGTSDDNKGPLLDILKEAGYEITKTTVKDLPKWSDVVNMYGEEPVIVGYPEQCHKFQSLPNPADHFVSTAGTFNSGTNLMAEYLIHNCHMPERIKKYGIRNRGVRWQVTWGKHTPVDDEEYRLTHTTYNETQFEARNIFPAVTVRDPFKWLQSMCRHNYGAHWNYTVSHCPNLVPNRRDIREFPWLKGEDSVPVEVHYKDFEREHASLVHFYNDWYNLYMNATFPRLLVRFEDLIFHPKQVTKTVCECAGGELNKGKFQYIKNSAKKGIGEHGKHRTNYMEALKKYGTEAGRYDRFEKADLAFANEHLDPKLMELFGYKYAPDEMLA